MATRGQQKVRRGITVDEPNARLSQAELSRREKEAERRAAARRNPRTRAQSQREMGSRSIPRSVRSLMISEAQDAQNRGDSQLRSERRGAGSNTRGAQKPAPRGIKDTIIRTVDEGSRIARRIAKGLGIMSLLTPSELGDGTLYKGKTEEEVSRMLKARAEANRKADEGEAKGKTGGSPSKSKGSSSSSNKKSHTVKSGDTLSAIAKKAGVTLKQLMAANPNIKDANKIRPGQKIKLPKATIKGTGKSIYMNKGGVVKANCGASMKPNRKARS